MKVWNTLWIAIVFAGCASQGDNRTGPPTCAPVAGMAEAQFLRCGCFRPYLNPEGGATLLSTSESQLGVMKRYSCLQAPSDRIEVLITNGTITTIVRR